jgi:hypothetical protein
MAFLAGAAWDADAGAQWVGVLAGAVASLALAVFFVVTAHRSRHWDSFSGRHSAGFRSHANAMFVLQVAWFAEAANDALLGAHWAWFWIGASWSASGSAGHEHFVFLALRDLWWEGEEHGWSWSSSTFAGLNANALAVSQVTFLASASGSADAWADGVWLVARSVASLAFAELFVLTANWGGWQQHGFDWLSGVAGAGLNADAAGISQETRFAEAANHAVLGAHWTRVGVVAGGWARRAASLELFVVWALELGDLWHDFVTGLALFGEHAFALLVFQVSLLTETADHALQGADLGRHWVGTIWDTSRSAGEELGVGTAFFGKSRGGDSERKGANAEQQRESKARVHR